MKSLFTFIFALFFFIYNESIVSAEFHSGELPECVVITHCVKANWAVANSKDSFKKVLDIIKSTPRTEIVEQNDSYLHAESTTRWMRYVDDLEIKAIPEKGILQVRSESRVGVGDNGVNQKRINDLEYRLMNSRLSE